MNYLPRLLFVVVFTQLLISAGCRQHTAAGTSIDTLAAPTTNADTKDNTQTTQPDSLLYAASLNEPFFEDFSASKPGYAAATVQLKTGNWYFADALIATGEKTSGSDKSARIRNNGKLSMQFDVKQADTVQINYAAYPNDAPSGWQLWLSTDGGASYQQASETITAAGATPQQAAIAINKTGRLRFEIRKTNGGKNRLIIQDFAIGKSASESPVQNSSPEETGVGKVQDDSNLLLGNPTGAAHNLASAENYLIDHKYYVISYSKTKCTPNWVSWHISADDLGNANRMDNFRPDKNLPGGWYEADAGSYKNTGFDKGHNCPSGDRTASKDANSSTFLMDNMIPQAPNNNQRTWEHLESYCRDQVKKNKEVYVVMGNYGTGGTGSNGYATTIDNGRINVPAHIWKVVVIIPNGNNDLQRIDKNASVIAVDIPNDNSVSANWMNYLVTVDDIEKATGCDLLSALPKTVQQQLESKKFNGGR